jgi:hypothetical protein
MANVSNLIKSLDQGVDTSTALGGVLFTDRRQFYVDPGTYSELWAAVTPFLTTIMQRGGVKTGLSDPMFKMFEHQNPWEKEEFTTTTAGTIPDDDTGITIAVATVTGLSQKIITAADASWSGLVFECWDSTKTTKRGGAIVTAVTAGSGNITMKNAGTTAFTTVSGDIFVCIGHVSGEGQTAPSSYSDELSVIWNSCGIQRTSVEITGTLYQASLRGANKELERLRKMKMETHKIRDERMLMRSYSVLGTNADGSGTFADKWRTDADSKKIRMTMGLIPALEKYGTSTVTSDSQNLFDFSGGLNFNQWALATEKIWQYLPESGVKDFFCGPRAMTYWSLLDQAGKLRSGFDIKLSDMKTDSVGVFFKYLETPMGIARLIYTPSMKREYTNYMLAVTPENIFRAEYRPMVYKTNIKTEDDYDGVKDTYRSDHGIGISNILSHCRVIVPMQ